MVYTICGYMLENECGLIPACRALGYKATAVHYFLSKRENKELFEEYRRVRFALIDMAVDKMDEVAEDTDVVNYNAQRVKLGAMQWKAAALRPDLYGGLKKDVVVIPPGSHKQLSDADLDKKIYQAIARLDALEGREPKPREPEAKPEAPADAVGSGSDDGRAEKPLEVDIEKFMRP